MQDFVRWIEIDLDAIIHNFLEIRQLVPEQVKIMSVVKADAYGHGALEVSKALAEAGTDMLAVTTIEEGIELIEGGIKLPILLFAPMLPCQAETILRYGLIPTIDSAEALDALAKCSQDAGVRGRFHLKVESGLGRTGILEEDMPHLLKALDRYSWVDMEGIYSHFATAMMKDKSYAQKQFARFIKIIDSLKQVRKDIGLVHIANSAAILDLPETYQDMVRAGTLLYGQYPSSHVSRKIDLRDPWQMKGRIVSVKKLKPGDSVGYGRDFIAKKPMEVGVVPVGYADGFGVLPHTRPARFYDLVKSTAKILSYILGTVKPNYMLYETKHLPVIGRIAMQLSMIDITGLNISAGTEVKIPMRRTTSGARLPRIFLKKGCMTNVRTINRH